MNSPSLQIPRFDRVERFAHWFADTEPARRAGVTRVASEVQGALTLAAGGLPFTLRARADRIDITAGGLVITDYKTGAAPTAAQVIAGVSPQLSLEAAIALADGFTGIASAPITALTYIRVTGGEPPGEVRQIKVDDIGALAGAALVALASLIAEFDHPATPYRALRRAQFDGQYRFDAYAHLARVAEWSGEAGDDGDGDGGGS